METSELSKCVYGRLYSASDILLRYRTVCILVAFIVWAMILVAAGYFDENGHTNNWFLWFGFLWITGLAAIATYLIPRFILRVVPLMNGYAPEQD